MKEQSTNLIKNKMIQNYLQRKKIYIYYHIEEVLWKIKQKKQLMDMFQQIH
jgi:hypothetical protein